MSEIPEGFIEDENADDVVQGVITIGDVVGIRNFIGVIDEIKAMLPKSWPETPKLKAVLTALQVRAERRSAKDGHQHLWEEASEIFLTVFGDLDCGWKKRIYAVWAKRK